MDKVNPRTEADTYIAQAFQVVINARGQGGRRDYTPDELDTLFAALGAAVDQLRRVSGGEDAVARRDGERLHAFGHRVCNMLNVEAQLDRLDDAVKQDNLGEAEKAYTHPAGTPGYFEVTHWEDSEVVKSEAVKIVRRTFGDDVDLGEGMAGAAFVKLVTAELAQFRELRKELMDLAASIRTE